MVKVGKSKVTALRICSRQGNSELLQAIINTFLHMHVINTDWS